MHLKIIEILTSKLISHSKHITELEKEIRQKNAVIKNMYKKGYSDKNIYDRNYKHALFMAKQGMSPYDMRDRFKRALQRNKSIGYASHVSNLTHKKSC